MAPVTRREFTTGLVGATAVLAASRAAGAQEAKAGKLEPSVFGGVQVGVQSYTFRKFDLDRMIAAMRSIGISSLELWQGHLDPAKASEADFTAVRGKLDAAGIKVGAYCVNFRLDSTDELLERGFRGAKLLGTNVMTASVQKPIVPRLDEKCRKHEIFMGIHNHWFGDPWFKGDRKQEFESPEDWAEALKGSSRFMAINLDVGHFNAAGHDPVAYFRQNHERIVSLHVKDRDKDAAHTDRPFGEGAVPLKALAQALKDVKFRYAANLEYEMDENDPTEGTRHSFEYFKKALLA
jgi:sugar phosphate isomerase/epimerase